MGPINSSKNKLYSEIIFTFHWHPNGGTMKVELWRELHCCRVMVQRLLGDYDFNVRVFGE